MDHLPNIVPTLQLCAIDLSSLCMAYSHLSMAINWQLLFLSFLLPSSFMNKSCVYGARDVATSAKGHPSSPTGPQKSLHRSLNSVKEESYTTDAYGESISFTLSTLDDGNFGATVGLGTPKRDFPLLFDTGSDLTWVRCQTCSANCDYQQQPPIFYPSISSTFTNASCESQTTCACSIKYKDGSHSDGYCANDTLSLTPSDVVPGFVFGCTQTVEGEFGGAAGVLGIGRGMYSLLAQTDTDFFSTFCYCLPASENSTGYLQFGVQAFETCQPDTAQVIKLTVYPNQMRVNLTAITIGQKRLEIPSNGNTIIDTGTPISRLPPLVYGALSSSFREIMSMYPIAPPMPPLLDTCYNLEGYQYWTPPDMVLHFDGSVDVMLDPSAVTVRDGDSKVCLAFTSDGDASDTAIIGNQQHRERNVFYDINARNVYVGMANNGCSI